MSEHDDRHGPPLALVTAAALFFLFGIWSGWPGSYDQHDATTRALRMLWARSLDPGVRFWGAVAYQEVLLLVVAPLAALKRVLDLDQATLGALAHLGTRILWALHGLGIVLLTHVAARDLFRERRTALLASLLCLLAPGLLLWAHTPQVDVVHAFWVTAAFTLAVRAHVYGTRWPLYGAALAAGLAAGVKYVGGIVVLVPMWVAWRRRGFIAALGMGVLAVGVFFITTPLVSGDPLTWLTEYLVNVLANQHRETEALPALVTQPFAIADLLGPGTVALALLMPFIARPARQAGVRGAWILLALAILPYYLVLGWQHVATVRYVVPLVAPLSIVIARATMCAVERVGISTALRGFIAVALALNTVLATALSHGIAFDTRAALAQWLQAHARPDDVVETLVDHRPYFTAPMPFKVVPRPHFQAETAEMAERIAADHSSPVYHAYRQSLRWADREARPPRTWVDRERDWLARRAEGYDTSPAGPPARGARYVVINLNTTRYYILDWQGVDPLAPAERNFVNAVLDERAPYRRRAHFESAVPEWLRYPRELWFNISPTLDVYEVEQKEARP
jgi:hypothetical protein